MRVIVPIGVTDAMLVSSTAAEPGPGEVAWNATTAYAADAEVFLASTHRRYRAATANTGRNPATDTTFPAAWVDIGPTNRWAGFDTVVSTQVTAANELTMVLRPGFFNAIAMFGLLGGHLKVTVHDAPGGNVIYSYDKALDDSVPGDWWEYWFGGFKPQVDFIASGIEPYNNAELTITITGGADVRVGTIAIGDMRKLGDSQYGAKSKLMDYSRVRTDEFGNTSIVRRRAARDISASAWVRLTDAPSVEDALDELRGVPAVWIATDAPNYRGLRTFGLGSGGISYDHPQDCLLTIDVKGLI